MLTNQMLSLSRACLQGNHFTRQLWQLMTSIILSQLFTLVKSITNLLTTSSPTQKREDSGLSIKLKHLGPIKMYNTSTITKTVLSLSKGEHSYLHDQFNRS